MNRQERLADTMTGIVVWVFVLFFAFAGGVWCAEQKTERETKEQPRPVTVTVMDAKVGTSPLPDDGGFSGPDPMVEDGYLRDDLPIDYETQMHLYGACLEFGIDYALALAVIEQETGFTNVMGDGGKAYGFFQVWPKWHKERMEELGVTDLMDPESNFRVGCSFLSECIEKYGLEKGLGYYNSGKAQVTSYSKSVMERMQKYGA